VGVHPGATTAYGNGVNHIRVKKRAGIQWAWASLWTGFGMYLMMKLWSSLYVTLEKSQELALWKRWQLTLLIFIPLLCQAECGQTPVVLDKHWRSKYVPFYLKHCKYKVNEMNHQVTRLTPWFWTVIHWSLFCTWSCFDDLRHPEGYRSGYHPCRLTWQLKETPVPHIFWVLCSYGHAMLLPPPWSPISLSSQPLTPSTSLPPSMTGYVSPA